MNLYKELKNLTKELNSKLKEMLSKDIQRAIKNTQFQKAVYLEERADCLEYTVARLEELIEEYRNYCYDNSKKP